MNQPKISIIAAISRNRVIGRSNDLIWRIPEDLRRFKQLTSGHVIVMGRKTFESIGRALPNRTNIIITRDNNFSAPGCLIEHSLEAALARAKQVETNPHPPYGHLPPSPFTKATGDKEGEGNKEKSMEIFIIGGGQIFKDAIHFADKLYLTIVDVETEGDTWFPDYSGFKPVITGEEQVFQGVRFRHVDFEKNNNLN